jgi:hypothetical protein
MGVLAVATLCHCPAIGLRPQRTWSWIHQLGLGRNGWLSRESSGGPLDDYCERGSWDFYISVHHHAYCYWGNFYNARAYPIYSSGLFQANGQEYDVHGIVGDDFKLDVAAYEKYGQIHISTLFALNYGLGFATLSATLTNVLLFHGK